MEGNVYIGSNILCIFDIISRVRRRFGRSQSRGCHFLGIRFIINIGPVDHA